MKTFFIFSTSIFLTTFLFAQIPCFDNPSFEGAVGMSVNPTSFSACNNTPDTQPQAGNPLGVPTATNGSTSMGLASPNSTQGEEAGTTLCSPLSIGQTYVFTIDLAMISSASNGMTGVPILEVWGGNSSCDKNTLLFTTPSISSTSFQSYTICFTPDQAFSDIVFRCLNSSSSGLAYIVLDNMQEVTPSSISSTSSFVNPDCGQSNGSATVNVSNGSNLSYEWFPYGGTSSTANNLSSGSFYCVITSSGSCLNATDTVFFDLIDNNQPSILIASATVSNPVCSLDNGEVTIDLNSVFNNVNYEWTPVVSSSSNAMNLSEGNYSVIINAQDVCGNNVTDTLNINLVTDSVFNINVSTDESICLGEDVVLNASSNISSVNYEWILDDQSTVNNSSIIVSPDSTYNYTVIGSIPGCVSDTAFVLVTVKPNPDISVNDLSLCKGSSGTLNVSGANNYEWSSGQTGSSIVVTPNSNVTYEVVGFLNGCTDTVTSNIIVFDSPIVSFISNQTQVDIENPFITVENTSLNSIQNYWSINGEVYTLNDATSVDFSFTKIGYNEICLAGVNEQGCSDTVCSTINVTALSTFYAPNSFTPDGDEFNNVFAPKGIRIDEYHLEIYNRWGELIFESNDFESGWDGTYKSSGKIVSEGVYIWKVNLSTLEGLRQEYEGHVSLLK